MELLIAALVAGGFVSLSIHLVRRSRRAARPSPPTPQLLQQPDIERDLDQLRAGDVLVCGRGDLMIEEVYRLQEGADSWLEARADLDGDERWLRVDPRDLDALIVGESTSLDGLGDEPSEAIDHGDEVYHLDRTGRAERIDDGQTVRYWNYRQPGSRCAWIRQDEAGRRVFVGERIRRHLFEMLPGEQVPPVDEGASG